MSEIHLKHWYYIYFCNTDHSVLCTNKKVGKLNRGFESMYKRLVGHKLSIYFGEDNTKWILFTCKPIMKIKPFMYNVEKWSEVL